MTTKPDKKKSKAITQIEKIRGSRLDFSDLLRSLRQTMELTQTELAYRAGTTRSKICDFEKGRRIPSLKLATKLAKALGHSETLFVYKIFQEQIYQANLKMKIEVHAA